MRRVQASIYSMSLVHVRRFSNIGFTDISLFLVDIQEFGHSSHNLNLMVAVRVSRSHRGFGVSGYSDGLFRKRISAFVP